MTTPSLHSFLSNKWKQQKTSTKKDRQQLETALKVPATPQGFHSVQIYSTPVLSSVVPAETTNANVNTIHETVLLPQITPSVSLRFMPTQLSYSPYEFERKQSILAKQHSLEMTSSPSVHIPQWKESDLFHMSEVHQYLHSLEKGGRRLVEMDLFLSDTVSEGDIELLRQKQVRKIYHIYRENYIGNMKPTGLGDFIRSCYFIIQFCEKYKFEYEIVIQHPISEFLALGKNTQKYSTLFDGKVSFLCDNNWANSTTTADGYISNYQLSNAKINTFISFLGGLRVIDGCVFCYNIFFPTERISLSSQKIVQGLFAPSREMDAYVSEYLRQLDIESGGFGVFHIRSGDKSFANANPSSASEENTTTLSATYINTLVSEISLKIQENAREQPHQKYLIISDNNEVKKIIANVQLFPREKMKWLCNPIAHVGEGSGGDRDQIKNTLLEFFLMSKASWIHSMTVYPHGSGFSLWCSQTYGIPYKCRYTPNGN